MPKMPKQRKLHDYEIETIRMVASGATNAEIAVALEVAVETVRTRLHVLHRLIGSASGVPSENVARIRMVIWAYDNGLVKPAKAARRPAPVRQPPPQEVIPAELAAPMIQLSLDVLADRPRGDLRIWARRVVAAAGLQTPEGARRGRPVAVADDVKSEAA